MRTQSLVPASAREAEHRPAVPSGISLSPHPRCRSPKQAENVPLAPAGRKSLCHLATSCAFIPCHNKPPTFPPSCFPPAPPHIICRGEGTLLVIPRRYLMPVPQPHGDLRASVPSSQPVPLPKGDFRSRVLGAGFWEQLRSHPGNVTTRSHRNPSRSEGACCCATR